MGKHRKEKIKIGTCKQCGAEFVELYNGLCEKHYIEKQNRRKRKAILHDHKPIEEQQLNISVESYVPPKNYGFTLEQIENRVLANCNSERLKEHRQCDYCHMVFDCKYYKYKTGKSLCDFLDNK